MKSRVMDAAAPSQFYTGLVAQLYAPLRSSGAPDPEPYARFIARSGEPALELGCGHGEPLLDLRSRGIDIEGLDSSSDMLDQCRRAALARGLDVILHHQSMERLDVERRFRSIFLAGPTFNLLPDDEAARSALVRIRRHLAPGGSALIPLFVPEPLPPGMLGRPRSHTTDDGDEMSVTVVDERRDEDARCQTLILRYELRTATATLREDRPWILHWYTQDGFRELADQVGLTITAVLTPEGKRAASDDDTFVVLLADNAPRL